ncbi:hypothetical protein DKK68_03160 [Bifidobacterium asteroides]|nr:hypothetical protein DKK68_03160 [Bifidobacterium asteroides]
MTPLDHMIGYGLLNGSHWFRMMPRLPGQQTGERMGGDDDMNDSHEHGMTELMENYREGRRRWGVEDADRRWLRQPLTEWTACLKGQQAEPHLNPDSTDRLAVAITETLAIRDGLILSILAPEPGLDDDRLLDLCVRPNDPANVTALCSILDSVFKDSTMRPDHPRCRAGLVMLEAMAGKAPPGFRSQPLAVASYVDWWSGGSQASGFAEQALADDRSCSLAAIVLALIGRSIDPAWRQSS